jgi:DNA-binding transcriptional ArsR family regulator
MVNNLGCLNRTFHALADGTRRAILRRLAQGEATVSELAAPHAMSLPGISKHIRVLEDAGLVRRRRRGRTHQIRLRAAPLKNAAVWLESYQRFWERQLDSLDRYLKGEGVSPKKEDSS